MRLIIVRHGDPDYSIDSLTEKGFREAKLVALRIAELNADAVYCSPLGRAQDTMKPYIELTGKEAQTVNWLEEFNYAKIKDKNNPDKDRIIWDFLPSYYCNEERFYNSNEWLNIEEIKNSDVEKYCKNVWNGVDSVLEKFGYTRDGKLYKTKQGNTKTVVFFCHFGVEAIILSHLFNCPPTMISQNFIALPTSVTTLITEEREEGKAYFRCQQFGDISHLYKADEPAAFSGRFCEYYNDGNRR